MGEGRMRNGLVRGLGTTFTVLGIVAATVVGLDGWADAAATQGMPAAHRAAATGA